MDVSYMANHGIKRGQGENITTDILRDICTVLDYDLNDMVEI